MPRVRVIACCLVVATTLVRAQQDQTFRSATHTVAVYATVVDATGRLVPDLTKDDFQVFDNDVAQSLGVFSNDVRPITVVVMLDRSGSMRENFDLERGGAVQFVAHLLPADKARVGSFSTRIEIDPDQFTSDKDELIRILYENLQDPGPTPLWGATAAAMSALARQEDRRVVLVLTDGYDNPLRPEASTTFEEVRDRSEAEEVMVYGIGLADACTTAMPVAQTWMVSSVFVPQGRRGRGGLPGGGRSGGRSGCTDDKPDPRLAALAASSGGGYYELKPSDDLGATFERVANELHHQYLLGFTATALDGKVHRLEVRLHKPDLTVRARQSYLAPTVH